MHFLQLAWHRSVLATDVATACTLPHMVSPCSAQNCCDCLHACSHGTTLLGWLMSWLLALFHTRQDLVLPRTVAIVCTPAHMAGDFLAYLCCGCSHSSTHGRSRVLRTDAVDAGTIHYMAGQCFAHQGGWVLTCYLTWLNQQA